MSGRIRDRGLESERHRGEFYGYRGAQQELQGVALIGHHILFAARTEAALAAFAVQARACRQARIILGEQAAAMQFWSHYAEAGMRRTVKRELLLVKRATATAAETPKRGLRRATLAELDCVSEAHALMIEAARGLNPLKVDADGFRERLGQRLEQGRVWAWIEDGRLIFKADIISETPEAFYLEGIYVNPDERGQGYGLSCLAQLSRELLTRTKSLCLLVSEQNRVALSFYQRAGFQLHSNYHTVYLHPRY